MTWYKETADDPNSAWIIDATYGNKDPSIALDDIKAQLVYANPAGLIWPDDWTCPAEDSQNCFPGPGR